MRYRVFALLVTVGLSTLPAVAQAPAAKVASPAAKTNWTPPKTSWGDPDLQGQWPATANIPMQRAAGMGERAELTDAELANGSARRKSKLPRMARNSPRAATSPSIRLLIGWSAVSRCVKLRWL